MFEKLLDFLDSLVGDNSNPTPDTPEVVQVVKSVDTLEKRAMFLVLEPSEADGTTADLHGDWYDEMTIQKACHDYNHRCERIGIMHQDIASEDEVVVQESYIAPCDFTTESGVFVKKGSWLMWLHFPSDQMWRDVEAGIYDSVSIECSAMGYDLE